MRALISISTVVATLLSCPCPAGTPFLRGDVNGDAALDVSDGVAILLSLFSGLEVAVPLDALDVDDDGAINITDAVYELRFLFAAGPLPAAPYPEPGYDPTPTDPYTDGDETTPAGPLPDLAPKALFLDADNVVNIRIANEGVAEVPSTGGVLKLFVDGYPAGVYSFASLPDDSFLQPGQSASFRSEVRIGGIRRRLAVFVDADEEVTESNEYQNTLTRTITPAPADGADLVLSELSLDPEGRLVARVGNRGTRASASSLPVTLTVAVDGSLQAEGRSTLPALEPSESATLAPDPPVLVPPGSRVRAELRADDILHEIDNSNNSRREIFPLGSPLAAYSSVLDDPKIREGMIWQGSRGVHSYSTWDGNQKEDLSRALLTLERDEPFALSEPPPLLPGNHISASDAWQIYVGHIAQSLWFEVHAIARWRLRDLPADQLAYLLDGRRLLTYYAPGDTYRFDTTNMGSVTAWNPRIAYKFLSNLGMIEPTQLETIHSLTDWMRGHLIHTSASDVFSEQFGYAGLPPVDRVLYALEGRRHKTAGCWGTSGLYAALLRSVNIPVANARTRLGCCSHSRPEFVSVGRSMPHGDDPYTTILLPSGASIRSSKLLYTLEDMDAFFLDPEVDCIGESCNSLGDQASYNKGKLHIQLSFDYMADYLLYDYARYGAGHLDDTLRGPRIGGGVHEYVRPYFSAVERADMVAAVEGELMDIGEGDIEEGKRAVISRWSRFGSNK